MGPSWAPTPKHGQASPGGPGQAGPGTPVPNKRGTAGRGRAKRGRAGAAGPGATGPGAAGPSAAGARRGRGPAQACPAMDSLWLAQPHGQRGRSLKGETTCPRDDGSKGPTKGQPMPAPGRGIRSSTTRETLSAGEKGALSIASLLQWVSWRWLSDMGIHPKAEAYFCGGHHQSGSKSGAMNNGAYESVDGIN